VHFLMRGDLSEVHDDGLYVRGKGEHFRLAKVDTAAILHDEDLRRTRLGLMKEVIEAANKCGYPLERAAASQQMKRTETIGAYKPSALLDWEAGRPLEIEPIWGEPLRRATAAGANAPRLEIVYALLKSRGEAEWWKESAAEMANRSS
jgi:ketopantoate reductase